MTDLRLPCHEGNPDDWYIGTDGKQYRDDDLLTYAEQQKIADAVLVELGNGDDELFEAIDKAIDRAEADAKVAALQRRRHAREACHDCLMRTRCLQIAIDDGEVHGTWGGYYEEEISLIRKEIERRKTARELKLLSD